MLCEIGPSITKLFAKSYHFSVCGRFDAFSKSRKSGSVDCPMIPPQMVGDVRQYRWSSARAHLKGEDDGLAKVSPMLNRVEDWKAYLAEGIEKAEMRTIERHLRTGRPRGGEKFIQRLEKMTGRDLLPKKPGPGKAS